MTWDIRSSDFLIDAAVGKIPALTPVNLFGHNVDVDSGTVPETVWTGGGLWVPPTAARIHQIASSSANDTSAGTGARSVRLEGLDADNLEITEDVTLNGTTNVATTKEFLRINNMFLLSAGSGKTNAGDITATADTDSTVTQRIAAGDSTSHSAFFSIPADDKAFIVAGFATIHRPTTTSSAMVEFALMVESGGVLLNAQRIALTATGASAINYLYRLPKVVVGPADIRIDVTYSTDSNVNCSAGLDFVYGNVPK